MKKGEFKLTYRNLTLKYEKNYECLNDWFSNNSDENSKLECPICRKEYIQNQLKKKKEIDFDKIYGYTTPILELLPD